VRITEAAVELHGTVGPARTTVSAVAERAGVQRATVYRHFPSEAELFEACSLHWVTRNPPPDPGAWAAVREPGERLRLALAELYDWYGRTSYMLENTIRDVTLVDALRPAVEQRAGYLDAAASILLRGRPERGAARRRAAAAIGHALAFETWRSLVQEQGLEPGDAVALMAGAVAAARRH